MCASAGETQRVQSGNIPEPSQDEADVRDVWVMMANTVPETSCSAGSETVCSDENRVGAFAQTLECSDDNHSAQEITFMCSDTVARFSIMTAGNYTLTTCMMLENTAISNIARSRPVLREPSEPVNSSPSMRVGETYLLV